MYERGEGMYIDDWQVYEQQIRRVYDNNYILQFIFIPREKKKVVGPSLPVELTWQWE